MTDVLGHLEQSQEQRNAAFQAAGVNQPITGDTLTDSTVPPLGTEPVVPPSDISGLDTSLPDVETPFTDKSDDFLTAFFANQDLLSGKADFESGIRDDVGLSDLRTTQEDLTAQIEGFKRQSLALQNEFNLAGERVQLESEGRGRTAGGVAPLTAAAQRRITLRQADIASQALTTSALLAGVEGRIGTAQRLVQEAVDKEFGAALAAQDAIIANLNVLQSSGVLTREQNEKAAAQKAVQEAEKTRLEDEKADKKLKLETGLLAKKFGAPNDVVSAIFNASSPEEAILLGGEFLQDPKAQVELATAKVNLELKKADLANTIKRTSLLGEKTPAEIKAEKAAQKSAIASLPGMYDKINTIDALLLSPAIDPLVGRSRFTRAGKFIGRGLANLKGAQNFIGTITQLTDSLTLQELVEAKARGATFGALSDAELNLLAASATKLNSWAVKDKNGKTISWAVDEASFKAELENIQRLTRKAIFQSQQNLFDDDELNLLDNSFGDDVSFDPSS